MLKRYPIPLLIFIILFSLPNHADTPDINTWTQQVLLNTLNVDYNFDNGSFSKIKQNYTMNAWQGIQAFFSNNGDRIREQKLRLHPYPVGPAEIADHGIYNGIPYWRVNQEIAVPELNVNLNFSVIIIASNKQGYLIQSITMYINNPT